MKSSWVSFIVLAVFITPGFKPSPTKTLLPPTDSVGNLVIITTDGFRWQELFQGADPDIIQDSHFTPDGETLDLIYGGTNPAERREKLMPFFWKVIAQKGALYGNRLEGSKVNVANLYSISYPGYNEILTGTTDLSIYSNGKRPNPNRSFLEVLNDSPNFEGKVAAFCSWDVFPYILNEKRSGIPVNSGYETVSTTSEASSFLNTLQETGIHENTHCRHDRLTFIAAREYMTQHKPRVVFLGLGETDEFGHQGRYDLYLQQANEFDRMVGELWHWIQTTPGYKDNTTLVITTDHGRGSKNAKWPHHGLHIKGSSQTWLALLGPNIPAKGEVKEDGQIWAKEVSGFLLEAVER